MNSADDLLWGVAAIGAAIGRTDRQIYHMVAPGLLPAKKIGATWVASRRKLLASIVGDDEAAA